MKRIKQVEYGQFCVFRGYSNANSCFIEKLIHAKTFLKYANHFLKSYLKIYDYILTRDGWLFVVKIEYQLDTPASSTWQIISERMRLFLSTFVRVTNKEKGRTGCLVHSSYEKYVFDTLGEAKDVINAMRKQKLKLYSGKKKYRSLKYHYRIGHRVGKGSIFLCSRDVVRKKVMGGIGRGVFRNKALSQVVLENLIKFTQTSLSPKYQTHPIKCPNRVYIRLQILFPVITSPK